MGYLSSAMFILWVTSQSLKPSNLTNKLVKMITKQTAQENFPGEKKRLDEETEEGYFTP